MRRPIGALVSPLVVGNQAQPVRPAPQVQQGLVRPVLQEPQEAPAPLDPLEREILDLRDPVVPQEQERQGLRAKQGQRGTRVLLETQVKRVPKEQRAQKDLLAHLGI